MMTFSRTQLKIYFVWVWISTIAFILLSEFEIIPNTYIECTPEILYALSLIGITLTVATTYFCLKMFKIKRIRQSITHTLQNRKTPAYHSWCFVRIFLLMTAIWFNAFAYYATLDNRFAFCMLISAMASIFCIPTDKELKSLEDDKA